MKQTTTISVEHVVVSSTRAYEQVLASLDARLGDLENPDELVREWTLACASWADIEQAIEKSWGQAVSVFSARLSKGGSWRSRQANSYMRANMLSVIHCSRSK
jgi:hypothetical protein